MPDLDNPNQPELDEEELQPEQPNQEVEEPEEQPVEEDVVEEEEPVEEEPEKPSRREQLRIQQLLEKIKQREEPAEPTKSKNALNYEDELEADENTLTRLNKDRESYGKDLYMQGIKQAESIQFHTRLEIDAPKVESKYAFLNKDDTENFHPALADSVNGWYLSMAGYDSKSNSVQNPNVRYADFVEGVMELAEEIAGTKIQASTKNIARQAATTGLRPDGSKAKKLNLNQAPQSMTDEELDAFIQASL